MDNLEIKFNDVPHSKPIRAFVQSRFERWRSKQPVYGDTSEAAQVEFFRSPDEEKIGCVIEFRKGAASWKSMEYGKGIHSTFELALKHLTEHKLLVDERSA